MKPETQLSLGLNPGIQKYSVKFISERGFNTTVTIETEEEMTSREILNLLEEIKANLAVYIYSRDIWS